MVVFTLILALTSGLLTNIQDSGESSRKNAYLSSQAEETLFLLVSSGGNPSYWESLADRNGVVTIGLMNPPGSISSTKWNALQDWNASDYPSLKNALGVPDTDVYITIFDAERNPVSAWGISPADSNRVGAVSIPTRYNGAIAIIQVQVHES